MGARRSVLTCAVCLLTIIMSGGRPASAESAFPADAACLVRVPAVHPANGRQDVAAARSGKLPGLGNVTASIGWDNRKTMTLVASQFSVSRTFDPLTREVGITVSGEGEGQLVIRLGGATGLRVSKAGRAIDISDAGSLRGALDGRAIAAFRERIGNYERGLIAGGGSARADAPHADGFLLVGAFISSLAGDPTAVGRARDLIFQRIQGRARAVRFDFKDCVTEYELYLMEIDTQRTMCLEAANGRSTWYLRAADRLGCEIEFMAQALAGEGQFVSCTALGTVVG